MDQEWTIIAPPRDFLSGVVVGCLITIPVREDQQKNPCHTLLILVSKGVGVWMSLSKRKICDEVLKSCKKFISADIKTDAKQQDDKNLPFGSCNLLQKYLLKT